MDKQRATPLPQVHQAYVGAGVAGASRGLAWGGDRAAFPLAIRPPGMSKGVVIIYGVFKK